ncbi:hypothetical protein JXR93_02965 [bacterium]|nr:hypothetical protein [bacterium]
MKKIVLFQFLIALIVWGESNGLNFDFTPTRALSMGGAQRAGSTKTDSAQLNPAAMISLGKKYIIDTTFQYGWDLSPNYFSGAIIDTRTSNIGGSLYSNYFTKDITNDLGAEDNYTFLTIGLGYAYPVSDSIVFGITGKYLKFQKNDENELHKGTFDLGLLIHFSSFIKLAVVGYNLTYIDEEAAPMQLGFGFFLGEEEMLGLEFDVLADFTAPEIQDKDETALFSYSLGIRLNPIDGLAFMAGYKMDYIKDENFWSLGLEYLVPKSRLEILSGYMQSTSKDSNRILSFSLRLYL